MKNKITNSEDLYRTLYKPGA